MSEKSLEGWRDIGELPRKCQDEELYRSKKEILLTCLLNSTFFYRFLNVFNFQMD